MIHARALVDDTDAIGPNTSVWAFAHIMAGARVGNHCSMVIGIEKGPTSAPKRDPPVIRLTCLDYD